MSAFLRSMASSSRSSQASNRLSTISRQMSTVNPTHEHVVYASEGGARLYQLNRPKQLNSLNHEMVTSLAHKVENWRKSELCSMVIGRGNERAFCAGGDVKQLVLDLQKGKQTALEFFKDEFQLNWAIARLGKPYVSIIDGITMGGGCGIAMPAQIRIATPRSHFAMPETKIGYAPDVGVNYYLAQLDGQIGAWLAITGQDVFGRAVYELGLATHYVRPESLPILLNELTQIEKPSYHQLSSLIASYVPSAPDADAVSSKSSPDGHTPIKGEIRAFLDETFEKKSIREIYKALDGAQNSKSLSDNVKAWAKEQMAIMDMRSPTGMAVALEGFKRARGSRRLDVTLKNDMAMATGFTGSKRATEDFITGVSAVLVDRIKDRPEWSPSSITDSSLEPGSIDSRFFSASSPHQKDRPEITFTPPSSSKVTTGTDSTWGKFRKYGLPSEMEVSALVEGSAPGSGAFKLTSEELIQRLLDERGDAGGARESEVVEVAKGIVERLCVVKNDGYLDWKRK